MWALRHSFSCCSLGADWVPALLWACRCSRDQRQVQEGRGRAAGSAGTPSRVLSVHSSPEVTCRMELRSGPQQGCVCSLSEASR